MTTATVYLCSLPPVDNGGGTDRPGEWEQFRIRGRWNMTEWQLVDAAWDCVTVTSNSKCDKEAYQSLFTDYAIQKGSEGWETKQKSSNGQVTWQVANAMYNLYPDGKQRLSLTGKDAALLTGPTTLTQSSCTRCDLQITLLARPRSPMTIYREYQQLRTLHLKKKRKTYLARISSTKGETLYYGSRRNGNMGRLYDKGMQLGIHPRGTLLRWEVEWRKKQSNHLWQAGKLTETRKPELTSMVSTWFRKRQFDVPQVDMASPIALQVARDTSDVDRQLKWLTEQVSPVVTKLIPVVGLPTVLESLGLQPKE